MCPEIDVRRNIVYVTVKHDDGKLREAEEVEVERQHRLKVISDLPVTIVGRARLPDLARLAGDLDLEPAKLPLDRIAEDPPHVAGLVFDAAVAVADDHQAALSVGIPLTTIWFIVWSAAGLVALVAGIMWGSKSGVQFSLSLIALKALPVLILGGFTSIPGAIVGGLIIGVGEKIAEVYWGPLVNGAIENWFAYMLALVFLLFRPQGLFGERIIERI